MSTDYQSILADVDPRRENQPAVSRARRVAKSSGGTLRLCICEYLNALAGGMIFSDQEFEKSREAYVKNLDEWLGRLVDELKSDGIEASGKVIWKNPRSQALLDAADEVGADLLIRSATQHSPIDRVMIGATDWELIRRAPMTLWLAKHPVQESKPFRAVAAVDPTHDRDENGDLDHRLLATGNRLCRMFSGELHAVHAFVPASSSAPLITPGAAMGTAMPPLPQLDAELLERTRESLNDRVLELTRRFGLPDDRVHVLTGDTPGVISDFVDEHEIDVVVAGAVSRSWLERLVIGNTAERLLEAVNCDIVVVKPANFSDGS